MGPLRQSVLKWLREHPNPATADLAELRRKVEKAAPLQRLLYLHTKAPSITSAVIGMAQHEPEPGGCDTLRTREEWPYETVHEAIIDGWWVVQFPDLLSPYDDVEMSYVGFEFILQKLEEVIYE